MDIHQQGRFLQADFFDNEGGLNTTDSPFRVKDTQAIKGSNYGYSLTGGFQKRFGHGILSSARSSYLQSMGYFLSNTEAGVKTLLRAADTKLASLDQSTGADTLCTTDEASPSSALFTDTTKPVVFSQFNTSLASTAWMAGGGQAAGTLYGYTGSNKVTKNGADSPEGSISLTTHTSGGTLPDNAKYYYAVARHKASTGVVSNCALDVTATTGTSGSDINSITVDLSGITAFDQTKYDKIYIYRSAVSGVEGFTVGDLAGTVDSSATSFLDTGAVQLTAGAVPRAGNDALDNSTLPSDGVYNVIANFKQRLVTASGSTLYLSDLSKPESWPISNTITLPSGGPITALGVIYFSTPTTSSVDEFLVVFKERECWVVTGSNDATWALKFIDFTGCATQPLLVWANGFLSWIDYRGVYIWNGSDKPIYCSRPIEYDFKVAGNIDTSKLSKGWGTFSRQNNEILWVISGISEGEQKLTLKMDLRLTLPNIGGALIGSILEGVFTLDKLSYPLYAGMSSLPNTREILYAGDDIGNTYTMYTTNNDTTNLGQYWDQAQWDVGYWDYQGGYEYPVDFTYRTRPLTFGQPGTTKRYHKVIVWCKENTISDLTVNYWVNYKTDDSHKASQSVPIAVRSTNAYWDQGYWDQAQWDLAIPNYTPVVFNLSNGTVGVEGDALTLEFQQADLNSLSTIAGFSVIYSEAGLRR